jgi:uroporphyrinogen-III synthase
MGIRAKGSLGKLKGTAVVIRKDGTKEEVAIEIPVTEEQGKSIECSVAKYSDPIIKEK